MIPHYGKEDVTLLCIHLLFHSSYIVGHKFCLDVQILHCVQVKSDEEHDYKQLHFFSYTKFL